MCKLAFKKKMIDLMENQKKTRFKEIVQQVIDGKSKLAESKDIDSICPDCFVAKIEIEFFNNIGHIKYIENSIKEKENRFELNKKLEKEDCPVIAIILESPHIDEYDEDDKKISPLKNPSSSCILSEYLTQNLFHYITAVSVQGNVYSTAKHDIENGIYRIKLVNAIQFQCSLGQDLTDKDNQEVKNEILEECLNEDLFQKDFIERIKEASIIINCCTGQKNGRIDGAQKQVQNLIDSNYPSKLRLYGYHPSSLHFLRGFKIVV